MKRQIAGINTVLNTLNKDIKVLEVFIDKKKKNKRIDEIIGKTNSKNIQISFVDKVELDKMAFAINHQGVIADIFVSEKSNNLDDILQRENPLILVLDSIQDPHNLGACLRSAAAFNVDAVIINSNNSAKLSPTVSKVASGGVEILNIFFKSNLNNIITKLKANDIWTVALTGYTEQTIYDMDFKQGIAIIMGNEDNGISNIILKNSDFKAKINMPGDMESLNVSVATGVTLSEAIRQRLG